MDYFKLSEMLFEKFFLSEDLQTDRDEIISYGASVCELKEPKFNPSKGKEFNYFTTISLCAMRQLAAAIRRKNSGKSIREEYSELKAKYESKIKTRK